MGRWGLNQGFLEDGLIHPSINHSVASLKGSIFCFLTYLKLYCILLNLKLDLLCNLAWILSYLMLDLLCILVSILVVPEAKFAVSYRNWRWICCILAWILSYLMLELLCILVCILVVPEAKFAVSCRAWRFDLLYPGKYPVEPEGWFAVYPGLYPVEPEAWFVESWLVSCRTWSWICCILACILSYLKPNLSCPVEPQSWSVLSCRTWSLICCILASILSLLLSTSFMCASNNSVLEASLAYHGKTLFFFAKSNDKNIAI